MPTSAPFVKKEASLHRPNTQGFDRQGDPLGGKDFFLRAVPSVPQLLGSVGELLALVFSEERPGVIVRVEVDPTH